MNLPPGHDDQKWSSHGLARGDAISQWRNWAANTIAPIEITVSETDTFAARWSSHGIGQLRLLLLDAPAQRIVHTGRDGSSGKATPSIQLIYARRGALKTEMGGRRFVVEPGHFVLLDNTRFYQMDMDTKHEAIDLMMPQDWLENYIPDPEALLARTISVSKGWGAPLGSLFETMFDEIDHGPLPRQLIADQIGALLVLATGFHEPAPSRHRGHLVRRILRRIEADYSDPELTSDSVAQDLGISQRYLQALLASTGTRFVLELNAVRLDRASNLLRDPRAAGLSLGEVAYRCGFLDPGYFARLFRRRLGVAPSQWRAMRPKP